MTFPPSIIPIRGRFARARCTRKCAPVLECPGHSTRLRTTQRVRVLLVGLGEAGCRSAWSKVTMCSLRAEHGEPLAVIHETPRAKITMLFNEKKAAQVAAFFLHKATSPAQRLIGWHQRMKLIKLMKLMYLAERRSMEVYGEPMIGDTLYSLDHGPVLSTTLNLINGMTQSSEGGWEHWISDRADHRVALRRGIENPRDDLLELSDADIEILEEVWKSYGQLAPFDLAKLTHEICPEWKDPQGSRLPIDHADILEACGRNPEEIDDLTRRITDQAKIDAKLRTAFGR